MARICENVLGKIGDTPLIRLNRVNDGQALVYAKVESFNPGGSVKDRIAFSMIEAGERSGETKKSTVIIEPTSGNTGIGLAMVCAVKGYRLILCMPDSMSTERRMLLSAYGAELELTPANLGMIGAIERAEKLKKEIDGAVILQQFKNPANTEAHVKTTAQEILNDLHGNLDIFVAGIGTGGTITGVGKVLKESYPDVKIIGIEPEGSAVLSGKKSGSHRIQGIGAGFIPDVLDQSLIDSIYTIEDEKAFSMMRRLAREEGLLVGISSGAAAWVAVKLSRMPENTGKRIVVILPDTGERYLSLGLFR